MKSMKTKGQIAAVILFLIIAGFLIWYVMYCLQAPDRLTDATLVIL